MITTRGVRCVQIKTAKSINQLYRRVCGFEIEQKLDIENHAQNRKKNGLGPSNREILWGTTESLWQTTLTDQKFKNRLSWINKKFTTSRLAHSISHGVGVSGTLIWLKSVRKVVFVTFQNSRYNSVFGSSRLKNENWAEIVNSRHLESVIK